MKFILIFIVVCILLAMHLKELFSKNYTNPYEYDSEYEMDLFQNDFRPDWTFEWLECENAFRATGGSLNIRHIYNLQEAKFKFNVIDNRLWVKYHYENNQYLNYEINKNLFAVEYSPLRDVFLMVVGEPAFHKSDIDLGAAAAYGKDEAHKVQLTCKFVDFDNNYAFSSKSVNEGYERFYNKAPREWKLDIKYIDSGIKTYVVIWQESPGELAYTDMTTADERYVKKTRKWGMDSETIFCTGNLSPGVRVKSYSDSEDYISSPSVKPEDYSRKISKSLISPYVLIKPEGKWEYMAGTSFINWYTRKLNLSGAAVNKSYKNSEIMPYIFAYFEAFKKCLIEFGYMHDSIMSEEKWGDLTSKGMRRENRVRLAGEIGCGKGAKLRLVSGWELDREDFGRFAYFDGGYLQFQGRF